MSRIRTIFAAVFAAFIMPHLAVGQLAAPEMRGMWVSRFEWPSANQATAKGNIDTIMQTLAANNYNTVFFQVRGQCDVHYPSPYEPWSNTYGWTDPGWDPLAYAIQKAHENGLEFHAYVNTHTLAQPVPPAVTIPQHKYNLHGPSASPEESWMIRTSPTASAGLVDGYYWISPGIPAASAWTRQAVMHIVKNYDIDGMHFDRIRTPGPTYSHDPVTEARFNGVGNPDGLSFADFMRSQITRDLRNIYGEIAYHKPNVKISAAPFGIVYKDATTQYQGTGTQSHHQWYQDSWGWMSSHVVDFMVPQIYWQVGSAHPFEKLLQDWLERAGGRHVVAGSTTNSGGKSVSALLAEHQQTRNQNGHGHVIFSQSSMGNYWNDFRTQRYQLPAPTPEMPWKTAPSTGIITGYALDLEGNPIVDAKINLAGDSYNYLSAADGFFAILDVAPGVAHSLTATKTDVGDASQGAIAVSAGAVTSVTLVLKNGVGSVEFDREKYALDGTVGISVSDGDLAGQSDVTVLISSTTESTSESVVLSPEGGAGNFRGTVALGAGTPVPADGIVQVQSGDDLFVSYHDLDNGLGDSVIVTDKALIDGAGPVIGNVVTATVLSTAATITFNTNEPASALVRYGTACGALTEQAAVSGFKTSHLVSVGGLMPETTYYYRVEATDEVGNGSTDDNGGACYQFTTPLVSDGLNETFENGLNGWTGTGIWRYIDSTDSCASSNSPTRAWYYGSSSCNYNTGATNTGRLTSPEFVVPAGAQLRFWSREHHENFSGYDTRKVFVRINGTDQLVYTSANNANAWYQTPNVNLASYAGQTVNLVFVFDTVDNFNNAFTGWYVDDVVVEGIPPQKATNPSPAHNAGSVNADSLLTWQSVTTGGSFAVHFGTSNPPPLVTTTGAKSFNPGALGFGTQYFWRIDTSNPAGTATGDLWTFTTKAAPEIAVEPEQVSFLLQPGAGSTTTVLVRNEAQAGSSNLLFTATAASDAMTSSVETVGTGELLIGGPNRYRGNIYEATRSGLIRKYEPKLGFTGAASLDYVVYESSSLLGTYNRIFSSTVAHTGTGTDFYSSGDIAVPVTAGKFYIVAVGWGAVDVTYPYDAAALPVTYGFAIERNGYGINSYPLGTTATNADNVNTYQQRITFESSWLGASPSGMEASVAPQSAGSAVLTVLTAGLAEGLYTGSVTILSNDPDEPSTTIPVALEVKSHPLSVSGPSPADGAVGQPHTLQLTWDPGPGADVYRLYFGMENPPPFMAKVNQAQAMVTDLLPMTTYYWRVDAINNIGTAQGPVYSFTTRGLLAQTDDWALYY